MLGCSQTAPKTSTPPPGAHSAALAWEASTTGTVVGYNVYRSTTPGGPYSLVTVSPLSGLAYTDSNVQPGQTYYYVVTAIDGNGSSSIYSNEVSAVIPAP